MLHSSSPALRVSWVRMSSGFQWDNVNVVWSNHTMAVWLRLIPLSSSSRLSKYCKSEQGRVVRISVEVKPRSSRVKTKVFNNSLQCDTRAG